MGILFHAFIVTMIVTFSFALLSLTSVGKESHFCTYETANEIPNEEVQEEEIEEVSYEVIDESVSIESMKKRDNQVKVRYSEIS